MRAPLPGTASQKRSLSCRRRRHPRCCPVIQPARSFLCYLYLVLLSYRALRVPFHVHFRCGVIGPFACRTLARAHPPHNEPPHNHHWIDSPTVTSSEALAPCQRYVVAALIWYASHTRRYRPPHRLRRYFCWRCCFLNYIFYAVRIMRCVMNRLAQSRRRCFCRVSVYLRNRPISTLPRACSKWPKGSWKRTVCRVWAFILLRCSFFYTFYFCSIHTTLRFYNWPGITFPARPFRFRHLSRVSFCFVFAFAHFSLCRWMPLYFASFSRDCCAEVCC